MNQGTFLGSRVNSALVYKQTNKQTVLGNEIKTRQTTDRERSAGGGEKHLLDLYLPIMKTE